MRNLRDKRVGIIGTGATGIQCIPRLAQDAEHLYVFQRTPSSVDVRANAPTDVEWFKSQKPGWQQERMQNFVEGYRGVAAEDLIQDGWSQMTRRILPRVKPGMTPKGGFLIGLARTLAYGTCQSETPEWVSSRPPSRDPVFLRFQDIFGLWTC